LLAKREGSDPSFEGGSNERRSKEERPERPQPHHWSKKFGVSPDELKAAVNKVGNSAVAVQQELSQ
jgi:hypothetical protein